MAEAKKVDLKSMNIAEDKLRHLKIVFPEVFTEGLKVDFEKLRIALGENVEVGKERFGINWPGKSDCFRIIQAPSVATLVPMEKESVNFRTSENLFIEGDNLEVLKLLQKSYYGKIKMIYIDPPYNTGNDFIYPDDYAETLETYLKYTGQVDDSGRRFSTNTEDSGRFHSKWLSMIYPRLYLARNLLKNDGLIFISIGQSEISNLVSVCNDIFGEENRISICTRLMKTGGQKGKFFSPNTDYVVIYAKNIDALDNFRDELSEDLISKVYTQVEKSGPREGEKFREMGLFQPSLDIRANQRYYIKCPDGTLAIPPGNTFPENEVEGSKSKPNDGDGVWRWIYDRYRDEFLKGNIVFKETNASPLVTPEKKKSKWNIYTKIWLKDRIEEGKLPLDMFDNFENRHSAQELNKLLIPFDFAKPSELIAYLISLCVVSDDDIVIDFFAGSASTAHAILSLNKEDGRKRKFIMVQLPEPCSEESEAYKAGFKTIADIGKERIRKVINVIQNDSSGQLDFKQGLDLGFKAFKLAQSNFNLWEGNVEHNKDAVEKQLEMHVEHINPKSSQDDILFELLLKAGFELTTKIEKITLAGKLVYSIEGGLMLICLENELTQDLIKAMAEMTPSRVICLDQGFNSNDQLKTNAVQIMKSKSVEDFRTI